ncbi:CAP domain-containing protein [Salinarimonas rosea]|uniref:CAP domain-containing protein n=1 Tax=Salinarimonas rosea TaxID=552063 RepID=UPI000694B8F2|nr:CAP domain-containing protein [Salinarimonas rosea]
MMDTPRLRRAAAALALLLATLVVPPTAAQEIVTGDLPALRAEALAEVNASREEAGLAPLEPGETLDTIAQDHAEDMLARGYFAHASPDGDAVGDRFRAAGGAASEIVAENLGTCDGCPVPPGEARVEAMHRGWMESPGHRANILRDGVTRFGFGIAADPASRRTLAVQTFAGPGASGGNGDEGALPLDPHARVAAAGEEIDALRDEAGSPPLEADDALTAAARDLLPEGGASPEPPALDLGAALPGDAGARFAQVRALVATCSGCGAQPTRADVERFAEQWAQNRRDVLTDADLDRFGFALGADGRGAKTAILLLAQSR